MRAFYQDPVMRWMVPDDDEFEAAYPAMFADMIRGWLITKTIWVSDEVVGFAGWQPPGRPVSDLANLDAATLERPDLAGLLTKLTGEDLPHPPERIEKFKAFGALAAQNTPEEEHWYLSLLGAHPDWQRQGVGTQLLHVGFERADHDGLGVYLETETEANVAYYQHQGFGVRTEWDVGADGPHMWGMWRPAQ